MSINLALPRMATSLPDPDRMHRFRLRLAYLVAMAGTVALLVYRLSYYWSSPAQRALSPKHAYLKPSGAIGLRLPLERIESRILLIRGHRVMLDSDLAELYGVTTKR